MSERGEGIEMTEDALEELEAKYNSLKFDYDQARVERDDALRIAEDCSKMLAETKVGVSRQERIWAGQRSAQAETEREWKAKVAKVEADLAQAISARDAWNRAWRERGVDENDLLARNSQLTTERDEWRTKAAQAIAERDEWKAERESVANGFRRQTDKVGEVIAERDKWKARAEQAEAELSERQERSHAKVEEASRLIDCLEAKWKVERDEWKARAEKAEDTLSHGVLGWKERAEQAEAFAERKCVERDKWKARAEEAEAELKRVESELSAIRDEARRLLDRLDVKPDGSDRIDELIAELTRLRNVQAEAEQDEADRAETEQVESDYLQAVDRDKWKARAMKAEAQAKDDGWKARALKAEDTLSHGVLGWKERAERAEVEQARLLERLEVDPGGSDKIDELEQALQLLRHECDLLKARAEKAEGEGGFHRCKCGQPWLPASGLYGTTDENQCHACTLRGMLRRTERSLENLRAERDEWKASAKADWNDNEHHTRSQWRACAKRAEAGRDSWKAHANAAIADRDAWILRAEKAEAERDEWKARADALERSRADRSMKHWESTRAWLIERDEWRTRAEKAEAELNEAHAELSGKVYSEEASRLLDRLDIEHGGLLALEKERAEKAEGERDEWRTIAEKAKAELTASQLHEAFERYPWKDGGDAWKARAEKAEAELTACQRGGVVTFHGVDEVDRDIGWMVIMSIHLRECLSCGKYFGVEGEEDERLQCSGCRGLEEARAIARRLQARIDACLEEVGGRQSEWGMRAVDAVEALWPEPEELACQASADAATIHSWSKP